MQKKWISIAQKKTDQFFFFLIYVGTKDVYYMIYGIIPSSLSIVWFWPWTGNWKQVMCYHFQLFELTQSTAREKWSGTKERGNEPCRRTLSYSFSTDLVNYFKNTSQNKNEIRILVPVNLISVRFSLASLGSVGLTDK